MLAESIIRIGRPIKNSKLSPRERIKLLTDVDSENCKNYFRHVFLVELNGEKLSLQILELGNKDIVNKKENFKVDPRRNTAFPISYPNGGNPLHAQGIYPLPCYLMYDPHIKAMKNKEKFKEVLRPRLNSTIGYRDLSDANKESLTEKVASLFEEKASEIIEEDKQLGILLIYDESLPIFHKRTEKVEEEDSIWIAASALEPDSHLYLEGEKVLQKISQAKFYEAAELGREKNAISTFSNQNAEVVSIYNKSWLWLSPTWEMPRSIYWENKEWTRGIKIDAESYEAYLYGVQFLKEVQVPVSSVVLKEMFAPITSVEAKKNMRTSSFEAIFGIPMLLPLADGDSKQLFTKYRRMMKKAERLNDSDLHFEILAGMKGSMIPESTDEYRLSILYYSGDLSRGNMHIRAVIEDVLPSVAYQIQVILLKLRTTELKKIQAALEMNEQPVYRTENLPSLLANAYGPGYLWESLQAALHREPLRIARLRLATAKKLNELANKEESWQMKQELIFYYSFVYFLKQYEKKVMKKQGGVRELADWEHFISLYGQGKLELKDLEAVEHLGFASGLLLKQFSNTYYQKTKKDFVKHRVMKFGSKLTPEMIWKNGLLRCEELAEQWDMGIAANFRPVLAQVLLGFLEKHAQSKLVSEKDVFMTAFWSGYLIYKSDKKNDKLEGENENDN
ncbi:hypothetical protein JT05_10540 [Desulfosporosinus sp. Tol-M]|nr:hypothetical protein JT05_10540 [Desulfosporosinus sp. Tol-M]